MYLTHHLYYQKRGPDENRTRVHPIVNNNFIYMLSYFILSFRKITKRTRSFYFHLTTHLEKLDCIGGKMPLSTTCILWMQETCISNSTPIELPNGLLPNLCKAQGFWFRYSTINLFSNYYFS